eukprot:3959369-Ditylum_brightwellii.AAC.1
MPLSLCYHSCNALAKAGASPNGAVAVFIPVLEWPFFKQEKNGGVNSARFWKMLVVSLESVTLAVTAVFVPGVPSCGSFRVPLGFPLSAIICTTASNKIGEAAAFPAFSAGDRE